MSERVCLELINITPVLAPGTVNKVRWCFFFFYVNVFISFLYSGVWDVWRQRLYQHLLFKVQAFLQYILRTFLFIELQEVLHTGTSAGESTTNNSEWWFFFSEGKVLDVAFFSYPQSYILGWGFSWIPAGVCSFSSLVFMQSLVFHSNASWRKRRSNSHLNVFCLSFVSVV